MLATLRTDGKFLCCDETETEWFGFPAKHYVWQKHSVLLLCCVDVFHQRGLDNWDGCKMDEAKSTKTSSKTYIFWSPHNLTEQFHNTNQTILENPVDTKMVQSVWRFGPKLRSISSTYLSTLSLIFGAATDQPVMMYHLWHFLP